MISLNATRKLHHYLLYAMVIVVSLALGIFVGARQLSPEPVYNNAQLLPAPKMLPEFNLTNHYGEAIRSSLWRGRWSLIFFGFTSCPDICPLELQKLGKLLRVMQGNTGLQVVFISVDPERDTPTKLRDYVGFFHPDIVALQGSNSELARTAQFFGAAYDRSVIIDSKLLRVPAGIDMPDSSGDVYQVNHSTRIFIVNPEGAYSGSFMPPFDVEQLEADLNLMMTH